MFESTCVSHNLSENTWPFNPSSCERLFLSSSSLWDVALPVANRVGHYFEAQKGLSVQDPAFFSSFFFFPGMKLSGRAAGSRDVAAAGRRLFLLILTLALQMTLCWGRGWLKCLADRTPVKKKTKKHIHPLASELGQMRHFETESCPKGSSCGFLSVARRLQLLKPFWEVLISLGFSVPFTYESTIKEY